MTDAKTRIVAIEFRKTFTIFVEVPPPPEPAPEPETDDDKGEVFDEDSGEFDAVTDPYDFDDFVEKLDVDRFAEDAEECRFESWDLHDRYGRNSATPQYRFEKGELVAIPRKPSGPAFPPGEWRHESGTPFVGWFWTCKCHRHMLGEDIETCSTCGMNRPETPHA